MRISDWSSDVCSSDLHIDGAGAATESEGHRDRAVGLLQSCVSACCFSTRSSSTGSFLPRRAARRRIPEQACALKKYFDGIEAICTTCHKKHTLAALGDTEILSVEHAPGDAAPGPRHTDRKSVV